MDPEIYHLLFETVNNHVNIRLINTYRGVPVTASGNVLELHGSDTLVSTTPLQILCIRLQKIAYLNFGGRILTARPVNSNLNDELMTLTEFEPAPFFIGQRKFVRVEPAVPIKAKFTSPRFGQSEAEQPAWFNTELIDLSILGAAVHLNALIYKQTPVYVDDSAVLKFTLKVAPLLVPYDLDTKAVIKNVTYVDENTVRVGLQTSPTSQAENVITHFVAQLQKIIIQELRERLDKERSISNR